MSGDWRLIRELDALERQHRVLDRVAPATRSARSLPSDLMSFVPAISPRFAQPRHLAPLVDALERAHREPLRLVVQCSPRLGKTETVLHACAFWVTDDPTCSVLYGAAQQSLVESKASFAREYAIAAGARLSPASKSKTEWLLLGRDGRLTGGGMRAYSIGGSPIGIGARVIVIDDPVPGRAAASSEVKRDRTWETLRSGWFTRLDPRGSIIIVQQRWHPEDPAGRALALGWDHVTITPFDERGGSIWPERYDLDYWRDLEIEVGPVNWTSQFMQDPRGFEGQLFGDAILCDASEVPPGGEIVVGADLAYTSSARSDEQAAVVMLRHGDRFWILDAVSRRASLTTEVRGSRREPGFVQDLRRLQAQYKAREIVQYVGGREDATISMLARLAPEERVSIRAMPNRGNDKLARIQGFLGAYRAGRVQIVDGPFADKLVSHLQQFTGERGGKDDLADACAAAFDALARRGGGGLRGRARGSGEGSGREGWVYAA